MKKRLVDLLNPLLAYVWEEGHQQGMVDAASYDSGGKYRGNPYRTVTK